MDRFYDASKISGYAQDAMKWAVATGLYGGNDTGSIVPMGNISRAQSATILKRFAPMKPIEGSILVTNQEYAIPNRTDKVVYTGNWKNDMPVGQGSAIYTSGLSYVGSWANGTINGWGVVTFANGERYVGEVKDHKANGYGVRTWNSGDRYEGELKDGARNGYGVYTWANGRWFEGEWKGGKPNGQGTKYDSDGRMLQSGLWKDGTFVKETQTPPTTETVFSVNDAVYKAGVTTATSMTMEKMYGSIVDYQVQFIFSAVTETATTIEVSVPINIWLDDIGGSADTSWTATTVFNKSTGEIISFHVDK